MKPSRVVVLVVGALLLVANAGVAVAQKTGAGADLEDAEGNAVGTAQFMEDPGGTRVTVQAEGLKPGEHGIHFHETGKCTPPDFQSAGKHFNPEGAKHGLENPEGPHAGDLPNLTVDEDGTATYEATTDRVSLSGGKTYLFDTDGSALVIHAKADDQKTDPAGDSGDRIACGAIKTAAASTQTAPASNSVAIAFPLLVLVGVVIVLALGIFLWRRS